MAKGITDEVSDQLRGETVGQLTPEAQGLWDKYNSIFGTIQGIPDRTVRLRSGATTQMVDPGPLLRQRALQKVLMGMTGTGLGQRAKPQPGMLAQMAPFVTALGSDPKFQKWLSGFLGNGSTGDALSGFSSGSSINDDWWSGMGAEATDSLAGTGWEDFADWGEMI